ncbi:MAG: MATE family efflux transporter, partial [Spirochaetia bacterium]|nr:MATE family efflux transporter [Spirochaetia bacterium]
GFNFGAKKFDRVRTAYWLAVKYATIFVTIGWLLIELIPGVFVRFFNNDNPELILLGSRALRICSALMPIIGFQVITSNYFQAVGKPLQSTFLSLSRQFLILIPLLYILPLFWGVLGVYSALPLSDILSFCIAAIVMSFELRNLREMQ